MGNTLNHPDNPSRPAKTLRSHPESRKLRLEPWGIAERQIPDPFNFFQNAPIHPDRTFGNEIPTGKAGEKLVLRTLMDSIVSVSACPQDLNPCNGFHPSPLMIRILEPSRDPS